ncbi:MAG: hypothetical protein ACFFE8_06195 [Candidatus Heimdallarchaeota archaeon]
MGHQLFDHFQLFDFKGLKRIPLFIQSHPSDSAIPGYDAYFFALKDRIEPKNTGELKKAA